MKVSGVILAAGQGKRMGMPKALVNYQGLSLLEHVSQRLRESQVLGEILVVTGAAQRAVEEEAHRLHLKTICNPQFATGIMSSLQEGLRHIPPTSDCALISLVDQPLIKSDMLKDFVESFQNSSYTLARPFYENTPGHPCLIHRLHFQEVFEQQHSDQGASFLFKKYSSQVFRYLMNEPSSVIDFDLPSDLEVSYGPV